MDEPIRFKMSGLGFQREIGSFIWLNSILTLKLMSYRVKNTDSNFQPYSSNVNSDPDLQTSFNTNK